MKEQLIQTAIDLWQKHGYHNVSVNEICASCGVTKGSFYYHFVNKESVILAYYSSCLDTAGKSEESGSSYLERIFALIRQSTDPLVVLNRDILLVFLTSDGIREASNYLLSSFESTQVYQRMVEYCRKAQECGEIRDTIDAQQLIDTALINMTGNMYRWVIDDKNFDLYERDRQQLEIILKK